MNYTDEDLIDIIKYGKCKCGAPGSEEFNCPFDGDINNDPNSMCNCCSNCAQACCDDI